jgi:signal transduction histidine kinase/DNA-binding response OmpR family regulator
MFDPLTQRFEKIKIMDNIPDIISFNSLFIDKNDRIFIWHSFGLTIFEPYVKKYNVKVRGRILPGSKIITSDKSLFLIENNDRNYPSPIFGSAFLEPFKSRYRQIYFDGGVIGFNYICQLSDGKIMMVSGPKLYLLNDSIPSNIKVPKVYLTSLKINDQDFNKLFPGKEDVTSVKRVDLNYRQNNLRIEFAVLNYLYPEYNRFRYFMWGIDRDTVSTANFKFTEYKKMRPGKYNFWFTGANNDGVWNTEGKSVEIFISHPWYFTALAFILYSLLSITALLFYIRFRLSSLTRERNNLEQQVQLRTAELLEKNRHIEELDRVKTKFFTEISHEIRTPLSLIIGPVDSLITSGEGADEERRMKWMDMIRRNALRLMKLVNQLLDISKLDAGRMKLTLSEGDLFKCIRILAYEYLSLAETRNITYEVEIPDEQLVIQSDRDKIEKVISNLLTNAFKFTSSPGKVSIKCEVTGKEKTAGNAHLIIKVSDTGVGIKEEDMNRIFDRFYRIEGAWEKDGGGTGIGLALAKEFVGLMHGSIDVKSEYGKGTVFSVRIPLGKTHLSADEYVVVESENNGFTGDQVLTNTLSEPPEHENNHSDKKSRILVVEDNTDLRFFIRDSLSQEYSVYEAENGREGVRIALAEIPDLIITDILMPDLNGVELCTTLKNDERTSHIPIIMVTAKTTLDDKITGLRSGADDYIGKPFDINELSARISNLLDQREKLRLRYKAQSNYTNPETSYDSYDEKFISRVTQIIMVNMADYEFDVGSLEEKAGMSRMHLHRKLKAITGITPGNLIRDIRMNTAAKMITSRTGNINEIAMNVGFANQSYFSKCFKETFGVTPREYMNRQNQG